MSRKKDVSFDIDHQLSNCFTLSVGRNFKWFSTLANRLNIEYNTLKFRWWHRKVIQMYSFFVRKGYLNLNTFSTRLQFFWNVFNIKITLHISYIRVFSRVTKFAKTRKMCSIFKLRQTFFFQYKKILIKINTEYIFHVLNNTLFKRYNKIKKRKWDHRKNCRIYGKRTIVSWKRIIHSKC